MWNWSISLSDTTFFNYYITDRSRMSVGQLLFSDIFSHTTSMRISISLNQGPMLKDLTSKAKPSFLGNVYDSIIF